MKARLRRRATTIPKSPIQENVNAKDWSFGLLESFSLELLGKAGRAAAGLSTPLGWTIGTVFESLLRPEVFSSVECFAEAPCRFKPSDPSAKTGNAIAVVTRKILINSFFNINTPNSLHKIVLALQSTGTNQAKSALYVI